MQILPLKTDVLKANFNLLEGLKRVLADSKIKICEGDILVLSSKIIALAEGRIFDLDKIKPSNDGKELKLHAYNGKKEDPRFIELVMHEADSILPGSIMATLKNGMLVPAAGLDRSNIQEGFVIGWPKNPQKSANGILRKLKKLLGLKKLGVILCDSHCQPLRWGVTGLAIAWSGFFGIEDARGKRDIYGKKLKVTKKAVAD
ncbi:MAG: coenzyme F420-0:L-glutamate ligase, partial [Patescibacteria group bacterium]